MKLFKMMGLAAIALFFVLASASPLFAQTSPTSVTLSGTSVGAGLGMGITIIGAGLGLGKIGAAALESMARQPGVAGNIQTAMIIIAAMLEGATLASVILCYLISTSSATF